MMRISQFLLLFLLVATSSNCMADEYSYEFTKSMFSGNGNADLNNIDWTVSTDAGYFGYDGTKGQQFGSKSHPGKSIILSTTKIKGNISEIVVNTSGAKNIAAELTVTVGNGQFGSPYSVTTTANDANFSGSASGEIKLAYNQTSSAAIYIKSIKVIYDPSGDSEDDLSNIVSVQGIGAFNALPNGQEARLYLSNEEQARVTYVYGKNAYIRDATSAVCLYGFIKTPAMAYNQHIAGYIVGKKSTIGNLPAMTATDRTNTTQLIIADPVTEENVEPKLITTIEMPQHYADWVTISNLTFKDDINGSDAAGDVKVVNTFGTNLYTAPVIGSAYSISGIANSTVSDGDRLSPIHNIATERVGNPTATFATEYLPMTLATGITNITTNDPKSGTPTYDLMGRRVQSGRVTKGVYIIKGKKYIK